MQKQGLKCVDARHLVHLAVGDDTMPEEEQQLTDHLHACSDCRAYHAGMVDAMHALERVRHEDDVDTVGKSIWPALSDKLKARRTVNVGPEPRRFNVAVAALCACSLMLALVTAVQNLPTNNSDQFANEHLMPSMNVGLSGQNPAARMVPFQQPDGTLVFVDRATGQIYVPGKSAVPNMIAASPDDEDLNF